MPIGAPELIIILVIALLILGPGKLPEVGASLGKTIREFRKASTDIQESVKVDTSPLPPSQQAPQAPQAPSQSTVVPPVAPVGPVTPIETPDAGPPEPDTAANPPTTETVASGAASNADPAQRAD